MTVKQTIARLEALGFTMGYNGNPLSGIIRAEEFDYGPNHICDEPLRDVFICQLTNGWCITSYINFIARQYRAKYEHKASILNIYAHGRNLDEAMAVFEHNFATKHYNPPLTHRERGVCENFVGGGTHPPVRA